MPGMLRIRRIYDDLNPRDRAAIEQAQQILRERFAGVSEAVVERLPRQLRNPLAELFRTILYVAESTRGHVVGFALLHHAPDLDFCYLDFISTARERAGRGIGAALYGRVREEALALGAVGVFMESLPDDPALARDAEARRQNAARLRFWEQLGARQIVGTRYETPVKPGDDQPPYLLFDDLGQGQPLPAARARKIVRAILERRYGSVVSAAYIEDVVASFVDDPVRVREPRFQRAPAAAIARAPGERRFPLVVNEGHEIHHVRERGYVEAPVRVTAILRELDRTGLFERLPAREFGEEPIRAVHDRGFVAYLRKVCESLGPAETVYPYVFPIRNNTRPPEDLPVRAGYYCIDTFTPLSRNAYRAARGAVNCALTATEEVLAGAWLAYALVRPPGHHAEKRAFGGFCYFNSAAIAAHRLSQHGRVAILDIDYHHGNGQQDIFYERSDVLTVSIHGHPRFAYPYFAGFEEETGAGEGAGYNVNMPLPEKIDAARYHKELKRALRRIADYDPRFLVVALGLDPAKGDPTGTWPLVADDFQQNGRMIGALGLPTLVVQEGGYRTVSVGRNARRFFVGLREGALAARV
jgi:acetoin utilization deacetylase AcuC-like enzyme/GNAT superfamily N-acetyltransferase